MNEGSAKQQIVEHIKNATNILVAVSNNPSVDSLSAALALTMMLNKMDKHATAVFSGVIPPAISFLKPEKTFEGTVSSLRDFIIALDKEKADRLRYKVENDVVRIFITPYRTTITEKDLEFSQGDFNVDLVIALGVEKKDTLDAAIVAHGRILHDAAVVTINANDQKSSLGSVDWHDASASSLSEMLMALSEALQPGVVDEPTATALLTGIVAATERFANRYTTPKVMTMSAQLMAAGANQQLIATKLEEGNELPSSKPQPAEPNKDGSTSLKENASSRVRREEIAAVEPPKPKKEEEKPKADGEMLVDHSAPPPAAPSINLPPPEPREAAVEAAEDALQEALASQGAPVAKSPTINELQQALKREAEQREHDTAELPQPEPPKPEPPKQPEPRAEIKPSWMGNKLEPPTMGGALSATSEQALEDKLRAEEQDRRHALLSHDHDAAPQEPPQPVFNAFDMQYEEAPLPDTAAAPFQPAELSQPAPPAFGNPQPQLPENGPPKKTLADIEAEAHAREAAQLAQPVTNATNDLDQARQAVSEALNGGTPPPAELQQPLPAQPGFTPPPSPVPPLPDFSTLPPLPPLPPQLPVIEASVFPGEPVSPAEQLPPPILPDQPSDRPADPGQFRIPGQ